MRLVPRNPETVILNCKTWLPPEKKNTFWGKKALKNTFPQQQNTTMKK